jgi:fused signal recognition particle receptor
MLFSKLRDNFKKTKDALDTRLNNIFNQGKDIDVVIDEIEETLILSDVSVATSTKICENLRKKIKLEKDKSEENIKKILKEEMVSVLEQSNDSKVESETEFQKKVILVVGVNGVGKTTSIAKLANLYKSQGKKVLLAAADTFRAGAIEQLDIWAKRVGTDIALYYIENFRRF